MIQTLEKLVHSFPRFNMNIEIKVSITDPTDNKAVCGFLWKSAEGDCNKKTRSLEREIFIAMDEVEKRVIQSFVNGWVLIDQGDNTGELGCIYCGYVTDGFDHGKANAFTKEFNPRLHPCKCRINISPSHD